jgi:hypothetical protein
MLSQEAVLVLATAFRRARASSSACSFSHLSSAASISAWTAPEISRCDPCNFSKRSRRAGSCSRSRSQKRTRSTGSSGIGVGSSANSRANCSSPSRLGTTAARFTGLALRSDCSNDNKLASPRAIAACNCVRASRLPARLLTGSARNAGHDALAAAPACARQCRSSKTAAEARTRPRFSLELTLLARNQMRVAAPRPALTL